MCTQRKSLSWHILEFFVQILNESPQNLYIFGNYMPGGFCWNQFQCKYRDPPNKRPPGNFRPTPQKVHWKCIKCHVFTGTVLVSFEIFQTCHILNSFTTNLIHDISKIHRVSPYRFFEIFLQPNNTGNGPQ